MELIGSHSLEKVLEHYKGRGILTDNGTMALSVSRELY